MLNTKELAIIKEALPYNATKLIKAKFERISDAQISRALNNPKHYRKDIIDAALEVIKEHREALETQKSLISELSTS